MKNWLNIFHYNFLSSFPRQLSIVNSTRFGWPFHIHLSQNGTLFGCTRNEFQLYTHRLFCSVRNPICRWNIRPIVFYTFPFWGPRCLGHEILLSRENVNYGEHVYGQTLWRFHLEIRHAEFTTNAGKSGSSHWILCKLYKCICLFPRVFL